MLSLLSRFQIACRFLCLAGACVACQVIANTPGSLDVTFGASGRVALTSDTQIHDDVHVCPVSDGVLIAATALPQSGTPEIIIAKFTTAGVPVAGFGTNGVVRIAATNGSRCAGIGWLPEAGRIVVGIRHGGSHSLRAYSATGQAVMAFGSSGVLLVSGERLLSMMIVPATDEVVMTTFSALGPLKAVVRSSNGQQRAAWTLNSFSSSQTQLDVCSAMEGSGSTATVIFAYRYQISSNHRLILVKRDFQTGQVDSSTSADIDLQWAGAQSGSGFTSLQPKSLWVDVFGELVLACQVQTQSGERMGLLRLGANGKPLQPIHQGALQIQQVPVATGNHQLGQGLPSLDGTVILAGSVPTNSGRASVLKRVFWNGDGLAGFGDNGEVVDTAPSQTALQTAAAVDDGSKMLVAGITSSGGIELTRYHLGTTAGALVSATVPGSMTFHQRQQFSIDAQVTSTPAAYPLRIRSIKEGVRSAWVGGTSLPLLASRLTEGSHQIEVHNGAASHIAGPVVVTVNQPPERETDWGPLRFQDVVGGSPHLGSGSILGRLPMIWRWEDPDGNTLSEGELKSEKSWESHLPFPQRNFTHQLVDVQSAQTGLYWIHLENADGTLSLPVDVRIGKDPFYYGPTPNRVVQVGSEHSFWINVVSAYPIRVKWHHNGRLRRFTDSDGDPYFNPVKMSDAGFYRALASVPVGKAHVPAIQMAVADGTPGLTVATVGATARIQARVKGKNLQYAWFKDGETIQDSGKYRGTTTGTLSIVDVDADDPGVYVCEVSLDETTARAAERTLVLVNDKPEISELTLPNARVGRHYKAALQTSVPATRYVAGKLPRGLTMNPVSGEVSGWPVASGTYQFTVASTNPLGRRIQKITLTIEGMLPGHGNMLVGLPEGSGRRGGLLQAKLGPSGAISVKTSLFGSDGRLHHLRYRFALTEEPGLPNVFATPNVYRAVPGGYPYLKGEIRISLDANKRLLDFAIDMPLQPSGSQWEGMRWLAREVPWHARRLPVETRNGAYNVAALSSSPDTDAPDASSFARLVVSRSGRVRLAGRAADKKPLVMNSWLTFESKSPFHAWRHNRGGFLRLDVEFYDGSDPNHWDSAVTGQSRWFKPPASKRSETLYPSGFDLSQYWDGSRYLPPRLPGLSGALVMNLTEGIHNLSFSFKDFNGSRHVPATLDRSHRASSNRRLLHPAADSVSGVKFNPRTGIFHGDWFRRLIIDGSDEITGPVPVRKYAFHGIILSAGPNMVGRGRGFARREVVIERINDQGGTYFQTVKISIPLVLNPSY